MHTALHQRPTPSLSPIAANLGRPTGALLTATLLLAGRGLAWKRSLSDIAQLGGALHILAPSSPRCWPEFACPITPATFQVQHSLPKLQRKHLGG